MLKYLLKEEKTFLGKLSNIALGYLFSMICIIFVLNYYEWLLQPATFDLTVLGQFYQPIYKFPLLIQIFFTVIMAPIAEEIIFRHLPFKVIQTLNPKDRANLLIPTVLFTSVVFGLMHQGLPSVLIQGVGGFFLACVYIKNGYSLWSSILMHALWNGGLVLSVVNL